MRRSNGIVTEKAHLNTDKEKFDSSYDRIFIGTCSICKTDKKKSLMNKDDNGDFACKEGCKDVE